MKKLLVLLTISALAAFIFVGCTPGGGTPDGGGGGGTLPAVTIEVDGAVKIGNQNYVNSGSHKVTVTFANPVTTNVGLVLTDCYGDFSKAVGYGPDVILTPDADHKVFTGYGYFGCCYNGTGTGSGCYSCSDCCETQILLVRGDCDWCYTGDVASVIVDDEGPEVDLLVRFVNCCNPCDPDFKSSVYIEWKTAGKADQCDSCAPEEPCCDDACTEVGAWKVSTGDICAPCVVEGTGCPVKGKLDCGCLLYGKNYTIKFSVKDAVGNATTENLYISIDDNGKVSVAVDLSGCAAVPNEKLDNFMQVELNKWYSLPMGGGCLVCDFPKCI